MSRDPKAPHEDLQFRSLWLALMIITSLIVGMAAGMLSWAGGDNAFTAVRTGGASIGGSMLVLLAIFCFATHSGPKS